MLLSDLVIRCAIKMKTENKIISIILNIAFIFLVISMFLFFFGWITLNVYLTDIGLFGECISFSIYAFFWHDYNDEYKYLDFENKRKYNKKIASLSIGVSILFALIILSYSYWKSIFNSTVIVAVIGLLIAGISGFLGSLRK